MGMPLPLSVAVAWSVESLPSNPAAQVRLPEGSGILISIYICIYEVFGRVNISGLWRPDNDGQMIFGDLGGLERPDICLTGEEKLRKNLTQETCPDRGSNRARCPTGAHATAWPTAVDLISILGVGECPLCSVLCCL